MKGTQDLSVPSVQLLRNLKLFQNKVCLFVFQKLEYCHIALQAKFSFFSLVFLFYHHYASLVFQILDPPGQIALISQV